MGIVDALFEVTDERLQALYHRAWLNVIGDMWMPGSIRTWIRPSSSMPESTTAAMMMP